MWHMLLNLPYVIKKWVTGLYLQYLVIMQTAELILSHTSQQNSGLGEINRHSIDTEPCHTENYRSLDGW